MEGNFTLQVTNESKETFNESINGSLSSCCGTHKKENL